MDTCNGTWADPARLLRACARARQLGHAYVADRLAEAIIERGVPREWTVCDHEGGGGPPVTARHPDTALDVAMARYDGEDYDTDIVRRWPIYVCVTVRCDATAEMASGWLAVHQPEPKCSGGEHAWEPVGPTRPGVGPGVIEEDRCTHCGCVRTIDTMDINPATGYGTPAVTYRRAD